MRNDFAVFIDRDGTINVDVDFLSRPEQLELIPRSAEAIRALNGLGIPVVVITNQSGIARGLFSEQDLAEVHAALDRTLAEHGASVLAYYYCPHHPREGVGTYRKDCRCRKPGTGMLDEAAAAYGFDLRRSFVVGDKAIDVEAGRAAGAVALQVATGYGEQEKEAGARFRDHYAPDLFGAVQYIITILSERP
ncbi:MAG: HAD family hydrolase [Bacteroidetes bacterium]|nr:MAG: HAD family hydrolase [Bacteroidota bacterium]